MNFENTFTKKHKGCEFSAYSLDALEAMIANFDLELSIFHRSKVYTYENYARTLDNGEVELVEFLNNGEITKKTTFPNKEAFYNSIDNH